MIKTASTIKREKEAADELVANFIANGGVIQYLAPTAWDEEAERPKAAPRVIGVETES
jgi:hypothetical protein|tara:strand:+ start:2072 stop:2245 length:174 start_codon:yes stop_codon:yes gene_type:complete